MKKLIADTAIILLIFALLFTAINVGAWYYLQNQGGGLEAWTNRVEVPAQSRKGVEVRQEIFGTDDREYLASLEREPSLRAHPVLQFTSGLSTEQYTVGLEGIRYLPDWTDAEVSALLADASTGYVFGGSTTFGHGVPNESTVVAYMNAADDTTWLNFGVNAHDSIRETDKLLHLLRQGYRPAKVVFIDGLNDLTTFMASPYRTADKPRTQGFLIDRGRPALLFGTPTIRNMRLSLAYAFPITHLYFYLTEEPSTQAYGELDANQALIDYRKMAWHYKYKFEYSREHFDKLKSDWSEHYRRNMGFIRQLGETFGFEAWFVYQPIGYMEPANPFLTARYADSDIAEMAYDFDRHVKQQISNDALNMHDCSNAFVDIDAAKAFVDATHYSPFGNAALAQCIITASKNEPDPGPGTLLD